MTPTPPGEKKSEAVPSPAVPQRPATPAPAATGEQQLAARHFEVDAAIRAMGFIVFNTINSRWLSISDLKQTMVESFAVVTTALERFNSLRINAAGGELAVNGEGFEITAMHARELARHLSKTKGCNFAISRGLTQQEFDTFMDFLCTPEAEWPAGMDFTESVLNLKCPHIVSRKTVLREVSEEEAVVSKKELEHIEEEQKNRIEADVLAILSGEQKEKNGETTASLVRASGDAGTMAGLIMQVVEQKKIGTESLDKEKISAMIVECLDKAFDALLEDPFSKTQKGKKAIASALKHLEEELLHRMDLGPGEKAPDTVTTAVERMTERLKMDSIVQDYTRKLKALEDSEKSILRFMKMQGINHIQDGELEKKLDEEGVDVSQWHKLLAMTRTDENASEAERAVTQLASLLQHLEQDVGAAEQSQIPGKLAADLHDVKTQMGVITEQTRQKIETLAKAVQEDMAAADALEQEARKSGLGPKTSRREMVRIMAEVVQEISQPLAVISCSLEMIRAKALGEVNKGQVDMLNLAAESASRIKTLVDNLGGVAGQPDGIAPGPQTPQTVSR